MTPVTRLEEWIEPRAAKILGVFAVLIVIGAAVAYVVRQHDVERISHIERVIRCEDHLACRTFIRRAIHDILQAKHAREAHRGVEAGSGESPSGQPAPGQPGAPGISQPGQGGSDEPPGPRHPGSHHPSAPHEPGSGPTPAPGTPAPGTSHHGPGAAVIEHIESVVKDTPAGPVLESVGGASCHALGNC